MNRCHVCQAPAVNADAALCLSCSEQADSGGVKYDPDLGWVGDKLAVLRTLRSYASFGELWGGNGSLYLLGDRSDEDSSKHIVVARRPVCRDGDAKRQWQHDAKFIAACVTYVLDRIETIHIRDVEGRIRRFFEENVGATRTDCAAALRIDRRTVWKHLKRMRESKPAADPTP